MCVNVGDIADSSAQHWVMWRLLRAARKDENFLNCVLIKLHLAV